MIPYGRQDVRQEDIDAVLEVLRSDYLTQGPAVPRFEASVSAHVGARYALAVNSATSALHIACLALDLGPGDLLWTSPITFVASANCALYCGAEVDFVDIDPLTFNMSAEHLKVKLETASKAGRLPKVLVPVHMSGQPCDMASISALAHQYGVRVIEDASHAIGGTYQNGPIGNCVHSDITVLSFHPVKIITTAEGGMVLTNDERLAGRMSLLRSHGITRDASLMTHEPDGPWYYQQIDLGFNYRMTDLQAALGSSQMARLGEYVMRRHEIAAHYNSTLTGLPLTIPWQHPSGYSAYHLYVVQVHETERRRAVFEALRTEGIGVNLHYIPVHVQPYYSRMGFALGDFPNAEHYYAGAISLPMFPNLTEESQSKVVAALEKVLL
jgi:UDP-4-amino-4,6-dideoxy-N-acetyl-beta-L-altrosamine transaminase